MSEYVKREDVIKLVAIILAAEAQIGGYNVDVKDCIPEAEAWVKDYCSEGEIDIVRRKAVKGYEGYYEVDMYGNVYSIDRVVRVNDNGREYDKSVKGRKLKQSTQSKGYKVVPLTKDGETKSCYVHRIVAEAYIDNPYNLPFINHKDEDKTNNFVGNLEWCTEQYNSTYGNARKKQADALRGKPLSEEHKEKIRQGNIGKHGKPYGEREGE